MISQFLQQWSLPSCNEITEAETGLLLVKLDASTNLYPIIGYGYPAEQCLYNCKLGYLQRNRRTVVHKRVHLVEKVIIVEII